MVCGVAAAWPRYAFRRAGPAGVRGDARDLERPIASLGLVCALDRVRSQRRVLLCLRAISISARTNADLVCRGRSPRRNRRDPVVSARGIFAPAACLEKAYPSGD